MWECVANVAIFQHKIRKIDHKTLDTIFVGFALDSNVNHFLVVASEISEISNTLIKLEMPHSLRTYFPLNLVSRASPLAPLEPIALFLLNLFTSLILNPEGAIDLLKNT